MHVYFDTSCLCRPLDDRSVPRNAVEREAILAIFTLSRDGVLRLSISEVVIDEIDRTPDEIRRSKLETLARAIGEVLPISDEAIHRAIELQGRGFKAFDALHVAVAEVAGVDRLCTGDDRLRKKCLAESDVRIGVVSPLELFQELQP